MRTWTPEDLEAMPTLCTGQADDLKMDLGNVRVWLARCGPADGYHGKPVILERLRNGRWEHWADVDAFEQE